MKDSHFEAIAVLVIREVLGGDMRAGVEAVQCVHGELAEPSQGIKTGGEAREDGCVDGFIQVKVLPDCCYEVGCVRATLLPLRSVQHQLMGSM